MFYKIFFFNWFNLLLMFDYFIKKRNCGVKIDLFLLVWIIIECDFIKFCVNIYSYVELY